MNENKPIISYLNNKLGIKAIIAHNNSHYYVKFYDIDANEELSTIILYPFTEEGFFKAHFRAMHFIASY